MYLQGFLQYNFLQGLAASTNQLWVSKYQDPFNKNYFYPASAAATSDPAGAYARLSAAFAQIQNDAVTFVNSFPANMRPAAQATIDGWKRSDFPLIQGLLNGLQQNAGMLAPTQSTVISAPSLLPVDQAPLITAQPSAGVPVFSTPASPGYYPAPAGTVSVTTAPTDTTAANPIMDWLPWIAGAAVVGFLMTSGKRKAA